MDTEQLELVVVVVAEIVDVVRMLVVVMLLMLVADNNGLVDVLVGAVELLIREVEDGEVTVVITLELELLSKMTVRLELKAEDRMAVLKALVVAVA